MLCPDCGQRISLRYAGQVVNLRHDCRPPLNKIEDAELIAEVRVRLMNADADRLSKLGIMLLNVAADAAREMHERNVQGAIETSGEESR